ncbi:MAG TPA: hypothetical protein VFR78_00930 [Pyrinomonadaceae bacterium]|nr:hypothetical protein [Pyrinomonadaceae bacterium]
MTKPIVDKARREVDQGNLWRAKEILQGAMRRESYDVELFEMMGMVLLRMGDLPEAGRFLFLSGVRRPEYLEAIEIFLSRHRRKKPDEFVQLVPRKARLRTVSEYPDEVAQVLREIGFPEIFTFENGRVYSEQSWKERVGWIACGTIALVILALIILGVIKLREIIGA